MCRSGSIYLIVIVSILVLTSCGDERRLLVNNRFAEGAVRVFLIDRSAGEGLATVGYGNGDLAISGVRISYFTKSVQLEIESAYPTSTVRVLGYMRSDSEGLPSLGPDIPTDVYVDLPAGPSYRAYQELVVMSVLGENSANKID